MSLFDKEKTDTHPAYGMVSFSRISGQFNNLFGTSVDSSTAVVLRIKRAEVDRGLNKDYIHSRNELIEVTLSPNQFSELLTTMNHGSGIPCTINHVNGERTPEMPKRQADTEKVRDEFKEHIDQLNELMKKQTSVIQEILSKKSILKSDRVVIQKHLQTLHREIGANFPYVLKKFAESTDQIITDAKSVVDAFVTNTIARAGIQAIEDNNGIVRAPLLEVKNEQNKGS